MVQSPLYGFQRSPGGLYMPSPGGLNGFRRQGMDQRKKSSVSGLFVGETHYAPNTAAWAVNWAAGAQAGDLALAIDNNSLGASPGSPAGWTALALYSWAINGYTEAAFCKVLTGADIAAGGDTFTGQAGDGLLSILIYRGPTSATVVGLTNDNNITTIGTPGFVRNAASKAVVFYCCTRGVPGTLVSPTALTSRINNWTAIGAHFQINVDEIASASYADNATFTYTGGSTETITRAIELT